jgi:hypothetical protein
MKGWKEPDPFFFMVFAMIEEKRRLKKLTRTLQMEDFGGLQGV